MEKGGFGNEAFNKFFKFVKKWYSSNEPNWDEFAKDLINMAFSYSKEHEELIKSVDKALGENLRVLEPTAFPGYAFMDYIEKRGEAGQEALNFDMYKATFTEMFKLFKTYQNMFADDLSEKYMQDKVGFFDNVYQVYANNDSFFPKVVERCFNSFEESMKLYKKAENKSYL